MENQKLPNATAVLVLGIMSILTCCCYGIIGVVLGVVGLVISKKDLLLYKENPTQYVNYSNLNIGRILCIIGIVLGGLYLIYMIFIFSTIGYDGIEQMQEEMMRKYGGR